MQNDRIMELKMKNEIKIICNCWNSNKVYISHNNFLNIQDTIILQKKIIKKLDDMDNSNLTIKIDINDNDILKTFSEYILKNIDIKKNYIFFEKNATRTGAVKIEGSIILKNCLFLLKESELHNRGSSIFFCTDNAKEAVCLWKTEYSYNIYIW